MADLMLRPLSVGEILDRSFALFRRRFGTLVIITLGCTGVPLLLAVRWFGRLSAVAAGGFNGVNAVVEGMGSLFLLALVFFIANSIANTAIVLVISEGYLGRTVGAGPALRRAVPFIMPVILLALLQQVILVAVGFVLMVPMGVLAKGGAEPAMSGWLVLSFLAYAVVQLFLVSALFVSLPSLVLETGANAVSALGRAWSLSKGNRGRIFASLLVFGIIVMILVFALVLVAALGASLLVGNTPGEGFQSATIVSAITFAVMGTLGIVALTIVYCIQTVTYYDLRVRKEGFDLELLESTMGAV